MDHVSKILIVDDRPENITALKSLLDDFEVDVLSAASGNEALALTLQNDFALALIDVQMPDMDGYETVRLMRKVEKTRFLPVIFLSAIYSEDQYLVQGIEAGAVDFITKPFNSRLLQGKIRIFLELDKQKKMLETEIERRRKIESELLVAKTRAEESDKLKSAFLANMSHEIRTPLTTIVGMGSLLAANDYPMEKKKEISGFIEKSSNSLLTIINDILDISKIEAGIVKISKAPVNINNLLQDLFSAFRDNMDRNGKNNIELRLKIPEASLLPFTDENRVRQIMSNLLNNAVKFTDKGYIEFGYRVFNNMLEFYVIDTGGGIPKDRIDQIFGRFQKIQENSNGTGLGLSIAARLAELLGGRIRVSSELNKGSAFIFTLPYTTAPGKSETERESMTTQKNKSYDWSSKSILIAEDEYPVYFLLENLFEPTKIKINWAKNGQEAIDAFISNRSYNAVLLDIRMPGLDGIETFRALRKIDSNIPIIAQTAYSMNEEREELRKIGFNGFIAKPFVRHEILKLVDSLIT